MQKVYKGAEDYLEGNAGIMKGDYDKKAEWRNFKEGELVLLRRAPLVPPTLNGKFLDPWIGPYEITLKENSHVYRIRNLLKYKETLTNINRINKFCYDKEQFIKELTEAS